MLLLISCVREPERENVALEYPNTKKVDVSNTYFGTQVSDPYRWLEDDTSKETADWVKSQNKITFNYLDRIPFRKALKKRLTDIWNYEKAGAPFIEGNYTYFYKNDGLQNQYVVYRYENETDPDTAVVFLNPNSFKEDGTVSLGDLSFSKDGRFAAYSISESGSDWRKIVIMNAKTKAIVGDTLHDIKFSDISWRGSKGFYYSSYDKPEGSELSAKTDQHKLYYHLLGTKQKEDQLIYGGTPDEKHRYVGGYTSEDDNYLFVTANNSNSGHKLLIKDLSLLNATWKPILNTYENRARVISNSGDQLFVQTNVDAPNERIITVSAKAPSPENWSELIPERKNVLNSKTAGGYIFAEYIVDAVSEILQYDFKGKMIRQVQLPDIGSVYGFNGKENAKKVYYSFTNYVNPSSIYSFEIATGVSELYRKSAIDFDFENYESRQVFYNSKDGTKIPMIITHKKGIVLNRENPTILFGYGGFNHIQSPRFSTPNAVWMEQGGVYAVANLRGGGEYGKDWHEAGTQLNKQNVFDDFIAGAEYLISTKYTSPDYLAIRGVSNGGLLVGAVMTQRPELFKVALPDVGVLDMLRYHTFTAGAGWSYDYGTSEQSKEMFEYLLGYSPVHNVRAGTKYPATLITTGDHDDRVVPAHSFKFASELQEKQSGDNPVIIRIETDAGHGAGTPIGKTIAQYSDIYGFTLFNMGYDSLPAN